MAMRANPGKFNTALDEAIWSLSLDGGADDELGSSSEAPGTWAGILHDGEGLARAIRDNRSEYPHVTKTELEFLSDDGRAGVIIMEDSDGSVNVKYYADKGDLERDWKECEEELSGDDDDDDELEPNVAGYAVGDRVQLHPATDAWMRGDRYGEVVKSGRSKVSVKLDKSGRIVRLSPSNISEVVGRAHRPNTSGNRPVLDRSRIERALSQVHKWEADGGRGGKRAEANNAARLHGLNDEERRVLFSALHIEASQRPPAHRKNTSISDRRKAGIIEGLTRAEMDSMEIRLPTFDWKQVGGDMSPDKYGGIIAKSDGEEIELIEIQPVREAVGDREAKDVGFPFWTKEATYDLKDLSLSDEDTQGAIEYAGLGESLLEMDPETRGLAIAEARLQAGVNYEEGPAGFSKDILWASPQILWWGGETAGREYLSDEDREFRREILGERYEVLVDGEHESWLSEDDGEDDAIEHAETLSGHVQVKDAFDGEVMWDSQWQLKEGERVRVRAHEGDGDNFRLSYESFSGTMMEDGMIEEPGVHGALSVKNDATGEEEVVYAFSIEKLSGGAHTPNRHSRGHRRNAGGEGSGHYRTISEIKDANETAGFYFFKKDTIKFWRSKIEPRVYGGRFFITSEQMGDDQPRLFSVREAAPTGRVTTVASGLRGKGAAEDAIDALLGQHTPNTPRPVLEREGTLDELLDMTAESMEPSGGGHVPREVKDALQVTEQLRAAVSKYEAALEAALEEVVEKYPPEDEASAHGLFSDNAPYLVLMTLRGEGVGIWDGDWDSHYGKDEIRKVQALLEEKLGRFADSSGSGRVNEALEHAVYEAMREAGYGFDDETYVPLEEGQETGFEFEDTELPAERVLEIVRANDITPVKFWKAAGGKAGRPMTRGEVDRIVTELGGRFAKNQAGHRRWHVFLNGELLEPVYMDPSYSAEEVKRCLIKAGYSSAITVDQPPDRRTSLPPHYRSRAMSQNRRSPR